MSEETYNQLRREWQEKLRHLELTLVELQREVRFHLDDLDAAMALMAKVADLYPRLDTKQRGTLLQVLAKQIIVDAKGNIVKHELNSPFVYLRSLVQNLSTPGSGDGGSEHVRLGVHWITTIRTIRIPPVHCEVFLNIFFYRKKIPYPHF